MNHTPLYINIYVGLLILFDTLTTNMSAEEEGGPKTPSGGKAPKLNERILSSLSRRQVAAHPWHDLDIGNFTCHIHIC